jgi:hypothetical protein
VVAYIYNPSTRVDGKFRTSLGYRERLCLEKQNKALRRERQEDQQFKASLGYIVRPCLKN